MKVRALPRQSFNERLKANQELKLNRIHKQWVRGRKKEEFRRFWRHNGLRVAIGFFVCALLSWAFAVFVFGPYCDKMMQHCP